MTYDKNQFANLKLNNGIKKTKTEIKCPATY